MNSTSCDSDAPCRAERRIKECDEPLTEFSSPKTQKDGVEEEKGSERKDKIRKIDFVLQAFFMPPVH
jgi:hypothetical protein